MGTAPEAMTKPHVADRTGQFQHCEGKSDRTHAVTEQGHGFPDKKSTERPFPENRPSREGSLLIHQDAFPPVGWYDSPPSDGVGWSGMADRPSADDAAPVRSLANTLCGAGLLGPRPS